jgi:hypothetical protein
VSTQVGYESSRSPLHQAAAIHFIETAVIDRSGPNHYKIVMIGKRNFLRSTASQSTTIFYSRVRSRSQRSLEERMIKRKE